MVEQRKRKWPWPALAVLAGLMFPPSQSTSAEALDEAEKANDLLVVDCLLPPRVRRLGTRSTYLTPRQPVKTTAVRCRIRGGEYTQPDQANYATALTVWLPQAKAGDPVAQYYVGQIFEKGLGGQPDYTSAALWYDRAAAQDYTAAQVSLGYLYEAGLGVPSDEIVALNWYRRAAGGAEDLVVLDQDDYHDLLLLRSQLENKTAEVDELQREVDALDRQVSEQSDSATADAEEATLRSLLLRLQQDLATRQRQLEESAGRIAILEHSLSAINARTRLTAQRQDLEFGDYHALVVGNSNYQQLPHLENAARDARRVAATLESRYGFEVRLLLDATRFDIMRALNELRESLDEKDNLLVYYAGHGARDDNRNIGYWQPVDAAPTNQANWIPDGVLSDHLDLVPAKHVFVVTDSVFSGLRTRSAVARLPQGMSDEQRYYHIRSLIERRSRLVLTSGRERSTAIGSSFTDAFLQVLEENCEILEASNIYRRLNEKLRDAEQKDSTAPTFATMRWARNDVADFFFVPPG